ncbi:MAG: hypothetical protein ACYC1C_03650 [Chloroflexota bacterium]
MLSSWPAELSKTWEAKGNPIDRTVGRLDAWLESMRGEGGYTGPVVHWWENSWLYTGPATDWRYEGIICGYLELFRRTGDSRWLARARRAGDDVRLAQLPDGRFATSSFQHGPQAGGTPHEAAVDIGLLELAKELRRIGIADWQLDAESAELNIDRYQLTLWNGRGFADQSYIPTLVPNKNGTIAEALILLEEVSGRPMMDYVRPAAEVILANQILEPGPRQGATVHTGTG